ncbi:hypothetical protein [Pseudomonas coronafaciens]|uniref:hypothetical protein n=1 Tax=Pseudomonas coronafaciens TaxID=53409 RepID=UPI000E3C7D12|nr:hypothetical protein [Pseudomonas coronafaciens]
MSGYVVTWTIYTESEGLHKEAAQDVAQRFFQARIAEGKPGSACVFFVTDMEGKTEKVDLAGHLHMD